RSAEQRNSLTAQPLLRSLEPKPALAGKLMAPFLSAVENCSHSVHHGVTSPRYVHRKTDAACTLHDPYSAPPRRQLDRKGCQYEASCIADRVARLDLAQRRAGGADLLRLFRAQRVRHQLSARSRGDGVRAGIAEYGVRRATALLRRCAVRLRGDPGA